MEGDKSPWLIFLVVVCTFSTTSSGVTKFNTLYAENSAVRPSFSLLGELLEFFE